MIRAFPIGHGGTLVHLHNVSGGILGGDYLELEVLVGPNAYAQLTSTGATRLYRSRDTHSENVANQQSLIKIAQNGLLEFVPDQLIPFAGSCYRQQTNIELAEGAGLFWWEVVAPGREASGEVFEYALLDSNLKITTTDHKPIVLERSRLEPRRKPLAVLARLGCYHYYANFYICRVGVEAKCWQALENELAILAQQLSTGGQTLWSVSTLVCDGLVVRALSQHSRTIMSGLPLFWKAAKRELYQQEVELPRKIY